MRLRGIGGDTSSGLSYSTNFPLTENPISENGAWFSPNANWTRPRTSSGIAYGTQTGSSAPPFDDSIACMANPAWLAYPNHWCSGVVHRDVGALSQEIELFVRCDFTNTNARGYEIDIKEGGAFHFIRWNGAPDDFTPMVMDITNNVDCSDLSDFKASVLGPVITVTCKGLFCASLDVQQWAVDHGGAYFADGVPGMGFWDISGAPHTAFAWDNWAAGVL
jgi:hypothetical protein